jgi:hypothetical protein
VVRDAIQAIHARSHEHAACRRGKLGTSAGTALSDVRWMALAKLRSRIRDERGGSRLDKSRLVSQNRNAVGGHVAEVS